VIEILFSILFPSISDRARHTVFLICINETRTCRQRRHTVVLFPLALELDHSGKSTTGAAQFSSAITLERKKDCTARARSGESGRKKCGLQFQFPVSRRHGKIALPVTQSLPYGVKRSITATPTKPWIELPGCARRELQRKPHFFLDMKSICDADLSITNFHQ